LKTGWQGEVPLRRKRLPVILIATMLALGACQSSGGSGSARATPMGQASVIVNDPCGQQLQTISEAILLYYAAHRQLPPTLDDLRTVTDIDAPLVFVCPASGEKYLYDPAGLYAEGKKKHIILYDAKPAHGGARWCIFTDDMKANSALTMDVLLVPEDVFETYQFRKGPTPPPSADSTPMPGQ
jgi:hypothetical protein